MLLDKALDFGFYDLNEKNDCEHDVVTFVTGYADHGGHGGHPTGAHDVQLDDVNDNWA